MIKIINYGLGNIRAFINLYKSLDIDISVANSHTDLKNCDKIILPGVGSFDTAIEKINNSGMRESLDELVLVKKKPVLGICVGMQIMLSSSEEGKLDGLSWIKSKVVKFDINSKLYKIPHMGWNNIIIRNDNPLLNNLNDRSRFYFLHSYYCDINNNNKVLASTNYQIEFPSVFNYDNIFGIQCHPEKSHGSGLIFLKNFSKI